MSLGDNILDVIFCDHFYVCAPLLTKKKNVAHECVTPDNNKLAHCKTLALNF